MHRGAARPARARVRRAPARARARRRADARDRSGVRDRAVRAHHRDARRPAPARAGVADGGGGARRRALHARVLRAAGGAAAGRGPPPGREARGARAALAVVQRPRGHDDLRARARLAPQRGSDRAALRRALHARRRGVGRGALRRDGIAARAVHADADRRSLPPRRARRGAGVVRRDVRDRPVARAPHHGRADRPDAERGRAARRHVGVHGPSPRGAADGAHALHHRGGRDLRGADRARVSAATRRAACSSRISDRRTAPTCGASASSNAS